MNIMLFGFKSCGKTYYGLKLAKKLKIPFFDTDQLLENLYFVKTNEKLKCPQIHDKIGEASFRALERDVISSLQNIHEAVISLGGGAVIDRKNIPILEESGTLLYLDTPKETIKKRIFSQKTLPTFLDPDAPEDSFERIYQERLPVYETISADKIATDSKSDQEVIDLLASKWEEINSHGK